MIIRHLFLPLLLLVLTACGGGGSSSSVTNGENNSSVSNIGALSVMITDDMSQDYAKVWVTVLKVTAEDSTAQQHVLFEDTAGQVVNLTELNGVAALLSTQDLIAGDYSNFEITLANDVTLIDKLGQTVQAMFNATGDPKVISVPGSVTITAGGMTNIGFDFDLKQFTYDPATGLVTPVLAFLDRNQLKQISLNHGEVKGRINEIVDAQTFTIQNRFGNTITVVLQATATIFSEYTGKVGGDTSALSIDQKIEAYGSYDADTMTLSAISAKIDDDSGSSVFRAATEVEGVVVSFDGTTLVLDVRDADFLPSSTTMEISNVANGHFTKGSLDSLTEGQWVEIKGTWEDPVFTAIIVEIEGGIPHWDDDHGFNGDHHPNGYAELKGVVASVVDNVLSINLTQSNHLVGQSSGTIDIDISNAWYKYGNAECLKEGASVKVKGTKDTTSGNVIAYTIEIKSGCGTSLTGSVPRAEVEGVIASIEGNVVTLNLIFAEYFLPGGIEVQIDVSSALFEHGNSQLLKSGLRIEAKGSWDGTQLNAYEVELKTLS
ncbi:MAG: DUF5666 domain-containing protein [Gammaproteobacteria bacterium]